MTTDHLHIYSAAEMDEIVARQLAYAKEGVLIGLCAAAVSGVIVGMGILLAIQAMFL